jgi:predicted DNA-binding mobile mystery protein A
MFKKQTLQLSQNHLDKRIQKMNQVGIMSTPTRGWIYTIRTSLGMTLAQLGKRLAVSPQAIAQLEKREVDGQITLSTLRAALRALGVESTHAVTSPASLREIIRKQAEKKAREIVLRTSQTMTLENQKNSDKHLQNAIRERTTEIEKTLPKYLWD